MQKKMISLAAGFLAASLACMPACCKSKTALSTDVLTQKHVEPNRIQVTVLVKNAFSINMFEEKAEQAMPKLDIIQVGNYTSDMGIADYEARLEHDDLTDIVMTWPLEVGEEYWEDRLLDLSSQPFSGLYNSARLESISREGKLYYLPGPSQVRAIVYNKTMFRENGWTVPTDFKGFLALCSQIEATGIRSLQLGLGNEEVLDTAFVGYSLAECFSKPADIQWLLNYDKGKGSFYEHFAPALNTFQKLIDSKVLQPNDLKLTYSDREYMLFNRKCAMVEDSVLIARMGQSYNGCKDEFGLMPFFNPCAEGDWARLYPVCYIGLNKHIAEPQNKEKYDVIMSLMDYISSAEGQLALLGDTGAMISSLNNVPMPAVPEIADILPALRHGRYSVFPVLKNAQGALRKGLAGMVEGTLSGEDVARMVDKQNANPLFIYTEVVLGEAEKDFSLMETGNFITDAMREESGCDIALFLDNGKDGKYNGKGVSAKLYEGDITAVDLTRILPDLRKNESATLWKTTMTGADLLRTLEYSIPIDNDHTGWFYYFSGMSMEYDPSAAPGSRIKNISVGDDKTKVDPKRIYSVAVMDHTVPEDAMASVEKTDIKIRTILEKALKKGSISPSTDGRFIIAK